MSKKKINILIESKRNNWLEIAKVAVPLLTLFGTIFIFYITRSIATNLNKLNYSPQIVITECRITDFKITYGTPTFYIVTAETKIKNIGNSNAHIMLTTNGVFPTGDDSLRNEKDSIGFSNEIKEGVRVFYSEKQIYPNQELNGPTLKSGIDKKTLVAGISSINLTDNLLPTDSIFTLHFWFVYTNDNDVLYDTYYWYTAKITNDPKQPWKYVGQSYSFHIYDNKEKAKMVADYKIRDSLKRSYISF